MYSFGMEKDGAVQYFKVELFYSCFGGRLMLFTITEEHLAGKVIEVLR